MTIDSRQSTSDYTGKRILRIIFYILAAIVLVGGLLLAYSFIVSAPHAIRTATIIFQNPAFNPIFNQIDALLRTVGTILLIACLLLSGALYGLGQLISQNIHLLEQVEELKARISKPG